MGEDNIIDFGPVTDQMQGIIKVVGVGGGGCNAVANMYKEGDTWLDAIEPMFLAAKPMMDMINPNQSLGSRSDRETGRPRVRRGRKSF